MSNPLLAPYPILSTSSPSAPYGTPIQQSSGGFLGADGFLSKLGETAVDLAGLYGNLELEKRRIEVQEQGGSKNPEILRSQIAAGMFPQFVQDNRVPIYIVGGLAIVGVLAAITIAATRGK